MKHICIMIVIVLWGVGFITAKGFWLTLLCTIIPFIGVGFGFLHILERFT